MNKTNEVPLVVADAFVMYYDNLSGKWMASGASNSVTIAKVQILQNLTSNQFRIFAWSPLTKEVLVTSIIYHNLRYQKAHSTFHEWRDFDSQMVYGIHFADSNEALVFGDVISKIFNSLEIIYRQCKELQETIRSQSTTTEQLITNKPPSIQANANIVRLTPANEIKNNTIQNPVTSTSPTIHYSVIKKPEISNKKSMEDLPTYENINVLLKQHQSQTTLPNKSVAIPSPQESNAKCHSSSDDSVRGLKRQPSSASSGYATVASLLDQYSPISNGLCNNNTPSIPAMPPPLPQISPHNSVPNCASASINTSPTHHYIPNVVNSSLPNSNSTEYNTRKSSNDLSSSIIVKNGNENYATSQNSKLDESPSHSSSFASQLQNAIQQRKQSSSQVTYYINKKDSSSTSLAPSESLSRQAPLRTSLQNNEVNNSVYQASTANSYTNNISQVDDIMSEMKLKLQRRKQLIDGYNESETDDYYSPSGNYYHKNNGTPVGNGTIASDIITVSNANKTEPNSAPNNSILSESSSSSTASSATNSCTNTNSIETKPPPPPPTQDNNTTASLSATNQIENPSELTRKLSSRKQSTGDNTQQYISKDDLQQSKIEILQAIRKDLGEVKTEIINEIRKYSFRRH